MYSSDGGTDPSKSNDVDIPISIHSSISSPTKRTISDFTLLYTTSTTTQYERKWRNPRTQSNKKKHKTPLFFLFFPLFFPPDWQERRVYTVLALKYFESYFQSHFKSPTYFKSPSNQLAQLSKSLLKLGAKLPRFKTSVLLSSE